jgi:hypothetical protein
VTRASATRRSRPWTWAARTLIAAALIAAAAWWWPRPATLPPMPAADPLADRLLEARWRQALRRREHLPTPGSVQASGRVVDDDRTPVPGVEVVFAGDAGEITTTTDLAGRYQLALAPGIYRAFVRGDGVLSLGWRRDQAAAEPPAPWAIGSPDVALAMEVAVLTDSAGIDLEVALGGTVAGRVVDADGAAVAGALVWLPGATRSVAGADVAETDHDGAFRLDVPAGSAWLAAAHTDFAGLDPVDRVVEVERGAVADITLVLLAGCIVRGRVVDADGSAASEGAVGREPEDLRSRDAVPIGAGGHFRWTTTEPGEVLLRAAPRRSVPSLPARLACRDGARFDDVVLVAGASDPALAGTVATAAGAAAAGAYLELSPQDPGGGWWQGYADRDGRWAVAALPPGGYRVRAILDGAGVVEQVIAAPGRGVVLRLGGAGSLAGRVTGAAGGFSVEVMPCNEVIREMPPPIRRWVAVVDGRYRVDGLPVCSTLAVLRAGGRIEERGVALTGGAVTILDVDFTPRRRKIVSGTVRRHDGSAALGATGAVVSMEVDGHPATPFVIAVDGSFRIEASVGDVIRAELDDLHDPSDRVIVSDAPGGEERVELRLLARYPLI